MTQLSGKTILVTGCNGFIGGHLCKRLKEEGATVIGLDKKVYSTVYDQPDLFLLGDMSDYSPYTHIEGALPHVDCVVHLAAQSSVYDSMDEPYDDARWNILGTIVALEIAHRYMCPIVYAASGGTIYGKDGNDEGQDLSNTSPYALSKKVGEDYLKMYFFHRSISYLSLRLSNVFGLGGKGVIEQFCKHQQSGDTIELRGGEQTRDFVYIDDVLDAFTLATALLIKDRRGVASAFDVASGKAISMEALALLFKDMYPVGIERDEQPMGEVMHHYMDPTEAKRVLGWEPTTRLVGGIKLTYDAIKEANDGQE